MAGSTRRTLLAGLVAAGTPGAFAMPAILRGAGVQLRLPTGPMRLERVLLRELGGGAAITVRRAWEVRFERQARGIVISGAQVSASVEAPPSLAELVRIEERRETQMFPVMLSDAGLVLAAGGNAVAPGDMAPALRAAEQMIASGPQS